jgi:hypothetical protein
VLQIAAHDGDRALFDTYRTRFENAKVPADRSRFMGGLGAFHDPELLEACLQYALTGPLRPQELSRLPFIAGSTPKRRDRIYHWMTENYTTIASRISKESLGFLPFFAGGCDAGRIEDARRFFTDPAHDAPGVKVSLAKVSDAVGDCIRLREREGGAVTAYLTQLAGNR